MTEMTKYEAGTLSWADLETTDLEGAKRFYSQLFGWQAKDEKIPGNGGVYTMAQVRGKTVVGMSALDEQMKAQKVPPHWNAYICVSDVDQAANSVGPAGGRLIAPPFDVMGEGRMAVIEDPTGAVLCLWQPIKHAGAELMNEPGSLCWAELMTNNPKAASDFYAKVLNWKSEARTLNDGSQYTIFKVNDIAAAGMMETPKEEEQMCSSWGVYFRVSDCNAVAEKTDKLGGKVCVAPREADGVGRFAVLQDPQGSVFQVLQPAKSA